MTHREVIEADLTWTGDALARGVQVMVDRGRIELVGKLGLEPTRRLARQALLPGFVSAHSHAFQRALRGRGETFPAGAGSFWSWREAMYALVAQLDDRHFHDAVRATFREMRAAGITTVGEFHYLHHSPRGADFAFDELVLDAARDAGIRIVLLLTYYKTGAIGQPLAPAQKRFETATLDELWRHADALAARLDPTTQSLGVAAHSIRGVPLDELEPLYAETRRRGLPFHMHVEEQRKEIHDCVAAYGATPLQLINERLASCEGFTAVHATHSTPEELARFAARGGMVCITPLTEANLGDGIPEAMADGGWPKADTSDRPSAIGHRPSISLGTDSNARISMLEEMRWLEYAQRLKSETRGVFRDSDGRNAPRLVQFATLGGARSLGVNAGRIEAGAAADFVAIDLDARALAEVADEHALEAIVFGAGDDVICATCVAGDWA